MLRPLEFLNFAERQLLVAHASWAGRVGLRADVRQRTAHGSSTLDPYMTHALYLLEKLPDN